MKLQQIYTNTLLKNYYKNLVKIVTAIFYIERKIVVTNIVYIIYF